MQQLVGTVRNLELQNTEIMRAHQQREVGYHQAADQYRHQVRDQVDYVEAKAATHNA